jgi:cell division protein ZapA
MSDKMKINLYIGGEVYPQNIAPEDEEVIRAAAKQVDMWFNKFRERYDVSAVQAMTMTAVQFAVEYLKALKCNDTEPYSTKIDELNKIIEEYIQNKG